MCRSNPRVAEQKYRYYLHRRYLDRLGTQFQRRSNPGDRLLDKKRLIRISLRAWHG
ncbi:MAG: hypothetical protein ACMG55_15470 [Microcoleus sp.]